MLITFLRKQMATEIERKFLVKNESFKTGNGTAFKQGYLSRTPERTVRVRIAGDNAYMTIKGKTSVASRAEFEYEIPVQDANELIEMCEKPLIEKTRHKINYEGMTWEVDVFHGDNQGLVVAEIELENAQQLFAKPEWLGKEVTDDARYYNSNLVKNPYSRWKE